MKTKKVSLLIVLSAIITLLFPAVALANPAQSRLSGPDRYDTAIQICRDGWTTSYYAVITTGENYPDALSIAPLAQKYNAPILLNDSSYLDPRVSYELQRLGVKTVFIAGGTGVISASVERSINAMGIATERLGGADRYETAIKIGLKLNNSNEIFIAVGTDFADALSIAPIAAKKGDPIVLVPQDVLPDVVKNFVSSASKTYVIGDRTVISDYIVSQLPNPERIVGSDKYDRNIAVLNRFSSELNFSKVYAATGENYPDALAGSVLAAKTSSPIFLLSDNYRTVTGNFFDNRKSSIGEVKILGGVGAVTSAMLAQVGFGNENTVSNINNGSFVAQQGDWIYYNNVSDSFKLYKIKTDGTNRIKVSDDYAYFINVVGDWIYYSNESDDRTLYKIKTDGTNKIKLSGDSRYYINVIGDWIYYLGGDNKAYKIKTDGTNKIKVSDDYRYSINVIGDWIYYDNGSDDYKLYKIKTDGTNKTKLTEDRQCYCINVIGDWIYYISGSLYKMKTDGTNKIKLSEDIREPINVTGDWIYYKNFLDGNRLYKIKTDGTSKIKVSEDKVDSDWINVLGDWVYYINESNSGRKMYRIKTDGTNKQLVQ